MENQSIDPLISIEAETTPITTVPEIVEREKMKLWIKIPLYTFIWTIMLAWGFIGINTYENSNSCILEMNSGFILDGDIAPFTCKPVRLFIPNGGWCWDPMWCDKSLKPLILLYPEKDTEVSIDLKHPTWFSATFPKYNEQLSGWSVIAYPDGNLLDHTTGQETYGLFWEGNPSRTQYDLSKWWVIRWDEVREFLYERLSEFGLKTKEKSDFIMYWYPKLQSYPYIQITFAGRDYTDNTPLKITPNPDSILRLFMVAKPLKNFQEIEPQNIEKFERKWFSVVEWGWTIISE
jgi:hypothetical protein